MDQRRYSLQRGLCRGETLEAVIWGTKLCITAVEASQLRNEIDSISKSFSASAEDICSMLHIARVINRLKKEVTVLNMHGTVRSVDLMGKKKVKYSTL